LIAHALFQVKNYGKKCFDGTPLFRSLLIPNRFEPSSFIVGTFSERKLRNIVSRQSSQHGNRALEMRNGGMKKARSGVNPSWPSIDTEQHVYLCAMLVRR
jgi:hypothetical protein